MRSAQPTTPQQSAPAPEARAQNLFIGLGLAGTGAALLLVAALLWSFYGTTVFFDLLNAGIATCL